MAVSVGNTSSSSGSTSSLAWSHTSNSNFLVVCISIYDDGESISSVYWGATALSLVSGTSVVNSGMGQVAIYAGAVADSGTNNVTVTLSGSADIAAGAVNFIGSDQTCGGVDTNNQDNVSASTCSVTGYDNDDYIIDAFMSDKNPTIGSNQTQLYDVAFGGASSANASYEDGQYGPNMGWTSFVNGDVAHAACVVFAGGASPQSRTVTAVSATGDARTIAVQPGQVGRTVSEATADADAKSVTVLAETSRGVAAASADADAPTASPQPGVAPRVVAAASADGDAPQVTVAPGGVSRSVSEATADADAPQASAYIVGGDQSRTVVEASASADAPAASGQPGQVGRTVVEVSAAADAPVVAAIPGQAARSVVAADADADAATVVAVPGVASRSVPAASADSDAPQASPSFVLFVSAASAVASARLVTPENLKYQHFNVRKLKRGYDSLPYNPDLFE